MFTYLVTSTSRPPPPRPNSPLPPLQSPFFLSHILSTPLSESLFNCVNPYRRLDAAQINFRSQPSLRQPRAIRRALSHKESPDVPWQTGAQWGTVVCPHLIKPTRRFKLRFNPEDEVG